MKEIEKLQFNLDNLTFTSSKNRINELSFTGAITKCGEPSDAAPGGSEVRTVFETTAVEEAIDTLLYMPVNARWPDDWEGNPTMALTGHDERFCVGVIKKAWVENNYVMCSGVLWRDNYGDFCHFLQNAQEAVGFSVEAFPLEHNIGEDEFMHITKVEFSGVCICWKSVAAYADTFISKLVATKNINESKGELHLTEEKMQEMLDAMVEKINASNKEIVSGLEAKVNELSEQVEKLNAEKAELEEKLSAAEAEKVELNAKIEAAKANVPAPTAGVPQTPAPKDKVDFAAKRDEINKMNVSAAEKVQLRYKAYLDAISE